MLLRFLEWLASGEKTPRDLVSFCLERIAQADGELRAWAVLAPEEIPDTGPLRGIPYGAKDIVETRGIPTEYGSALYRGRIGTEDAQVVQRLRAQGAVLLGKTHTTAFASFDPAPTRNPRYPGHTPGGSSSGSAAAVAAGMVPFAIGTQTLGSVIRPASYCGICGFRSVLVPMDGVLPFAPTLDTGGLFTETAADMEALWVRSFGTHSGARLDRAADFGAPREAVERLRGAGVAVGAIDLPEGWSQLTQAAYLINDYEGARTHAARYREFGDRLGTKLAALVRRGLEIPEAVYLEAIDHCMRMRAAISQVFDAWPVILSSAATGPAPAGFDTTGDPSANAPWSALLVPVLTVPIPNQPVGLQIAAQPDHDDALLARAVQAERFICLSA
jgi:Asp-tRNA(Asn)/Glu-tRNA(Gln) amidotransferase A subunit family amidase